MRENVVMAIYSSEDEARKSFELLKEVSNSNLDVNYVVSQAAIVVNNNNKFDVMDQYSQKFFDFKNTMIGGSLGILLGIIIGPLASFVLAGLGAMIGSGFDLTQLEDSENMLYQMYSRILDGEIAIIAIVQEENELELNSSIGKNAENIYRWDAAEINEEAEYAMEVREGLLKEARYKLKREKSDERKKKIQEYKNSIKQEFEKIVK